MRTEKEIQEWLDNNPIKLGESSSVRQWLDTNGIYDIKTYINFTDGGKTLPDVIEFANSLSPEPDYSKIIEQLDKLRKNVNELEKLVNKL